MGRTSTFLLLALAVLCLGVVSRLTWEAIRSPEPASAQQAGCSVVEEFNGNGDTTTPPFDISGERFLVNYAAVNTGPPEVPGVLGVVVRDANGNQVGNARLDGEGSNVLSVSEGPGQFTIEIISAEVDYTISVEDCEGGGGGASPSASPAPEASPAPAPEASPAPTPDPQPQRPGDRDTMLDSGGPKRGPILTLPSGKCLPEYPIKRGGYCYR